MSVFVDHTLYLYHLLIYLCIFHRAFPEAVENLLNSLVKAYARRGYLIVLECFSAVIQGTEVLRKET